MIRNLFRRKSHNTAQYTLAQFPLSSLSCRVPAMAHLNTVVEACVRATARAITEAECIVVDRDKEERDDRHPLYLLLQRPSTHVSGHTFMRNIATCLSLYDEAFVLIADSTARGFPSELIWIPNQLVQEQTIVKDGMTVLANWRVGSQVYSPESIIHIRQSTNNAGIRSRSPLHALLSEIMTDEQAAQYMQAMVTNLGLPGAIISPKDSSVQLSQGEIKAAEEAYQSKFSGEGRGRALFSTVPLSVDFPAFSPEQMNITAMRRISEERICAVLGVPAIVAGVGAGLEHATMANYAEAREQAYESTWIPMQRAIAFEFERALLPLYGDAERFYIDFDLSKVRIFQKDEDQLWERIGKAWQRGLITIGQAHDALRLPLPKGSRPDMRIWDMQFGGLPQSTLSQPSSRIETKATPEVFPQSIDPITREFFIYVQNVRKQIIETANRLFAEEITVDQWERTMLQILERAHIDAARYGRNIAGVAGDRPTALDEMIGKSTMETDAQFLRRFADDIRTGRYTAEDNVLLRTPIQQRSDMYAARLRGTASDAFVANSPDTSLYEWVLIAEQNCLDCPRIAAGGPYTRETLPATPGNGNTQCLTNCRCVLVRNDGVISPPFPAQDVGVEIA